VNDDEDLHSFGSGDEAGGGAGGDSKGVVTEPSLRELLQLQKETPDDGSSSSSSDNDEVVLEVATNRKSKAKSKTKAKAKAKAPILQPLVTGARMTTKGDRPGGKPNPLRVVCEPAPKKRRVTSSGNSQSSQSSHSSQSPVPRNRQKSRTKTAATPPAGHMFVFVCENILNFFNL
jgi:hypothetical protein